VGLEILEFGRATGEYSWHMTPEEIALIDDVWSRNAEERSYQEMLELIASGETS
jgi:hypothetical protein